MRKEMPHQIYYGSIEEDLLLFEQIVHGSRAMVEYYESVLDKKKESEITLSEFEYELIGYESFLEASVSDYLIRCASRTRIIQDSNEFKVDDSDGEYCPDKEAFERYPEVAKCLAGNVKLSIRECCNKIIHAKGVSLHYVALENGFGQYWDGICSLKGEMHGKPWHIEIDVKKWVLAMKFYYAVIVELQS